MKLIKIIKLNIGSFLLGATIFIFLVFSYNIYVSNQTPYDPYKDISFEDVKRVETQTQKSNFREKKLDALLFLVDSGIYNVENLNKLDSIYPDSLCHCY